jgi:hypothetical protein
VVTDCNQEFDIEHVVDVASVLAYLDTLDQGLHEYVDWNAANLVHYFFEVRKHELTNADVLVMLD